MSSSSVSVSAGNSVSSVAEFSILEVLETFSITLTSLNGQPFSTKANLVIDSRNINKDDVFCAVIGHSQDGREYILPAVNAGAGLIIAECLTIAEHGQLSFVEQKNATKLNNAQMPVLVPIVKFYQLNQQLFALAKAYYRHPQESMTIVGVTGTNGKTSTCQLIAKAFDAYQQSARVIGTTGAGQVEQLQAVANTTPNAIEIHQWLYQFSKENCNIVAMEASSHGLEQQRVKAELFDIAVFTNLTRDHLDYHHDMASYAKAKFAIFKHNGEDEKPQVAVLNGNDEQALLWLEKWSNPETVWLFGRNKQLTKHALHVVATDIEHQPSGMSFMLSTHVGSIEITSNLLGDFNVDNLLATIAVLLIKQASLAEIANIIKNISPIIGRMESTSVHGLPTAVIDYAHTPNALENALLACREHCQGELWAVFGCGGDRDKGKRAIMGQVAELNADKIVLTNDNPRSESAQQIIEGILAGFEHPENIIVQLDREQAVLLALSKAQSKDIVLLAGKGHEKTMIIGDKVIAYNERKIVKDFYQREVSA